MGELPFPAWDPVIFSIGWLQVRWYSMAYVAAFVAAHIVLTRLARARVFPLPVERVGDLIFWLVLGVMLGGRIGYCLFYKQELLTSWRAVAVWEGGLSFHGGLLGVILCAILFARSNRVSGWRVLDCLAIATPAGVFFVRIANFINGELYGRICDKAHPTDASFAPPWAMRFPTDPEAARLLGIQPGGIRGVEEQVREHVESGRWAEIMPQVPLRHPSQIYEAIGEGLIVGLVLLVVYLRTRRAPLGSGVYGGIFGLGYGVVRYFIEFYREPDSQFKDDEDVVGTVFLGMTMGQVLCSAMIAYGVLAIWFRRDKRDGLREDEVETALAET